MNVPNPAEFLTVADVAAEIGLNRQTVTRLIGEGRMPGFAVGEGKRVIYRIPRVQWEEWKAGRWQPTPKPATDSVRVLHRRAG